jgi:hypothetical protein
VFENPPHIHFKLEFATLNMIVSWIDLHKLQIKIKTFTVVVKSQGVSLWGAAYNFIGGKDNCQGPEQWFCLFENFLQYVTLNDSHKKINK